MTPYRASLGGAFGGGVQRQPGQGLDISGAIDAVTGGAANLIQQAYTRRQAEHAQRRQDEQLQLEREREERQREHEARMELASGIIRGGTTIERLRDPAPATPAMPTIADAFNRGLPLGATPRGAMPASVNAGQAGGTMPQRVDAPSAPSALMTPMEDGALGRVPRIRVTSTEDRYDPEQDRTRIRTLDSIGARGTETRRTEDVRQAGRVDRDAARHTFKLEEQADAAAARAAQSEAHDGRTAAAGAAHDGRVTARASAAASRPLSANGAEVAKRTILDGLVGYHKDEGKLRAYLTEDDIGKSSVQKYGITEADIAAALGRAQNHVADQVVHAAGTGSPERAAKRVHAARDAAAAPPAPPAATPAKGALPPLSKAERDRAAADPDYKAFKISKGYTF